jgi:hypothetical protein
MYLKKRLTIFDLDSIRINLSAIRLKLSPEPCCDFCGAVPVYVYAAHRMSTGDPNPCWRWCACKRCSHLIDINNFKELRVLIAKRVEQLLVPNHTEDLEQAILDLVRALLDTFHRDVIRVRTGV